VQVGTVTESARTQVNLDVRAGPSVAFAYEGWEPSGGLQRRVRTIWREGIFDLQRADQAMDAIREDFTREGYLQAKVTHHIEPRGPMEKRVTFTVAPGPRFEEANLIFPGAQAILPEELTKVLEDAGLHNRILIEPSNVRSLLERYYADHGYLAAAVELPEVQVDRNAGAGSIAIPLNEGPLYRFRAVVPQGNQIYSASEIAARAGIAVGAPYTPDVLDAAVSGVQELYLRDGYNDVTVNYELRRIDTDASVEVLLTIEEGKQHVLRQIVIRGNRETTENMILGQIGVQPGQVLTTPSVSQARSNLYETGAYQLVELNHPVVVDEPATIPLSPNQVPVDLRVTVHEIQPYRILAGGYFDTDRGPGFIADISNRNSLGSAKILGLRLRYDADLQESRLYFSQPFLRRFPVRSIGETYFSRDVKSAFVSDRIGVSFGQEARLGNDYVLTYGYRLERVRVINRTDTALTDSGEIEEGDDSFDRDDLINDFVPIPPFGSVTRRLAPLTVTIARDTRNDMLNATRGSFVSHGFAIGFGFMGSQQQYMRYFGQYFQFIPLSQPVPVPFKPNLEKARFAYAAGVRLGLGSGLNSQDLIQSERFFAGGGSTIRGFKQDQVGPQTPDGIPVGGESMFILNNELRFPIWSIFDGAAFLDVGNVYARVQDFNPFRVRSAAGLGLRLHTPWVMIRADYGVKLDRRPGESSGAFFVSIGQAF
jgi:outer membrane protein assembly complex protein YaeT